MIYADNAATTRLDEDALEAMLPFLRGSYGNASQPYAFAREPKKALKEARETVAACIGAEPDEIIFTSGGSEADNWAIKGCTLADKKTRATLTTAIEHHAVLNACAAIEQQGQPVVYMLPEPDGRILPETLERVITGKTRLVSVMFANNEIGTIQDVSALCAIAHQHGALFHTDAVQAVGHIPLDVHALKVDMLSSSAHKFNGPKGIGFLYIRRGLKLPSLIDGGAQEQGRRAGTENVAAVVGMAAALKKHTEHLAQDAELLQNLEHNLCENLINTGIDYTRNGAQGQQLPGLLSLSFPGADGEMLLHRLDLMGICVSTGAACDSRQTQISHVLQAVNLPEDLARGTIRVSFSRDNTPEEAAKIANAIVKIIHE